MTDKNSSIIKTANGAALPIGIILVLGFVWATLAAARGGDPTMMPHAYMLMLVFALGIFALVYGVTQNKFVYDPYEYDDGVVKAGVYATIFWGIAGMLVGVIIASQLAFPALLSWEGFPQFNFGRLRPLHTSGVIFGFGGNALIATSFYMVQRTCRTRLAGGLWPWFVFWGYQLFLLTAGTGYLLGITESREYAEPEWYVDIWLTIVWVTYLAVFMMTLVKRKEKHIDVANWFYLSFIVTIAMLHLVNNLSLPVNWLGTKSVSAFSGVQDAMTQWWYGHNAVGFFLTTGFLGMMYYFIPKRANRPVYSYKLSIVHFWTVIFIYIWAGPHHLHFTALPQWTQTLGMVFSIMLWMPSWGGAINGLMTLSGAWDKLRTDPVLRLLVVSVAFYAIATFEGPLMAIRYVNALSHYTDWTIGHVHAGALGWNGMVTFGAIYCMVPWLWKKKEMYSLRMVEWHFWLATIGILFYIAAMWVSGIMQGLMWREYTEQGFLANSFVETVKAMKPYYMIRAFGGFLYLCGMLVMTWNVFMTVRGKGGAYAINDAPPAKDLPEPSAIPELAKLEMGE